MLLDDLKVVVDDAKRKDLPDAVIKNLLKEVLQYCVLSYVYSSSYGKKLIFIGGSCLRICYGLNRLSEDLDFDISPDIKIDKKTLANDLMKYFKSDMQYKNIEFNISGRGKKIYLKFPVLTELGLAENKDEMKKLFVKIEIEGNPARKYQTDLTPVAKYGLNFIIKSYDLPTLLANKVTAVLKRTWQKGPSTLQQAQSRAESNRSATSSGQGKSKITFKGRDYYDLLWLLQKGIKPNMKRIKDLTGISNKKELVNKLRSKIKSISASYLKEDLINLFEDSKFVEEITKNYPILIKKYLKNI